MPEELHTCPKCQRGNFTAAGLRSHRCNPQPSPNRQSSILNPQSALSLTGESQAPDWSRARQILAGIKTAVRLSLAGQVLLGHELLTLKTELGFLGSGRRSEENEQDALFKSHGHTWDNWCKAELGISRFTADRKIELYQAAKTRVHKLGGQPRLIGLLETHPAKLGEEDHKLLSGMVDKLVDGESQRSLLAELKLVKGHVALEGGDPGKPGEKKTPPTAQQLAFAFFEPAAVQAAQIAGKISSLRIKQDYQAFLYQLDVTSADPHALTLDALESTQQALIRDATEFLADIKKAKAAKLQTL